jgi:ketosteroid isomerase-like protein
MNRWPLAGLLMLSGGVAVYAADSPAVSAADAKAVAEVLQTNERMTQFVLKNDADQLRQFFAKDCLVHGSSNTIATCDEVLASVRAGQLSFSSFQRNIERTLVSGDVVVLMGEEIVVPAAGQPGAGIPVHRRITTVWRKTDGRWQQFARQATVVKQK